MSDRILVKASELGIAEPGQALAAVGLGSCVVVALYDPDARIAGLAHPLLPEPPGRQGPGKPARMLRYVSTAVPELIERMTDAGADPDRLYARLVGGARMFVTLLSGNGTPLGERNAEASRSVLASAGVPIRAEAVGGDRGRSVHFRADDGELRVTGIGFPDVVL